MITVDAAVVGRTTARNVGLTTGARPFDWSTGPEAAAGYAMLRPAGSQEPGRRHGSFEAVERIMNVMIDFDLLSRRIAEHDHWRTCLDAALEAQGGTGLHLAVVTEPYLGLILQGRKTVESRFTQRRCAPFGSIAEGDLVLLKAVSGPLCGLARTGQVWFFDLASVPLKTVRRRFDDRICATEEFWDSRRTARWACLIELSQTLAIDPVPCRKRDRRGWVTLRSPGSVQNVLRELPPL